MNATAPDSRPSHLIAQDVLAYTLMTDDRGQPADRRAVESYLEFLGESTARARALEQRRDGRLVAAVAWLALPGRTALLLPASPVAPGIDAAALDALLREALALIGQERPAFIQALLAADSVERLALLTRHGFQPLTLMLYLQRAALYPWTEPVSEAEAGWIAYSARTHAVFAETILQTYVNSTDCPELGRLRTIENVIESHKAVGRFDPRLWELIVIDERPAGCLLLSLMAGGTLAEVVYVGVTPEFRGRGVGALLVRRALEQTRRTGARRLALVVDERNASARRLYERFGLKETARRRALILVPPETAPAGDLSP